MTNFLSPKLRLCFHPQEYSCESAINIPPRAPLYHGDCVVVSTTPQHSLLARMDALLPPKVNACILLGYVTHGYHWTPLTPPPQESFQRAEATFLFNPIPFPQECWSLNLKPTGWFSAFADRYNLSALSSDSSFCWGKEPSMVMCLHPMSIPEMLSIKGPGNRGAFSFTDKSKQTLKPTRFCSWD